MKMFLNKTFKKTISCNCDINPIIQEDHIDLITIAFNNPFLVENQMRLIKKRLVDTNYSHTIADNSSDPSARKEISELCKRENIGYISLPKDYVRIFTKRPSYSHGAAMNWVYYNYIRPRNSAFFGFIDHDLFPIKDYSILEKIKNQDFYGHIKERGRFWYLWAGFCFFKTEKVSSFKLNFFPFIKEGTYLDTGGSNYPALYENYNKETLFFASPAVEEAIREGDDYHADFIHYIDAAWLHSINGSNWKKVPNKNHFLQDTLSIY